MRFSPKLVIFDLDGTLVEFPHDFLFAETERIIAELSHPPVDRNLLEECFRDFDFFRFVEREESELELFVEQFWASFDMGHFPKATPLPGALELLQILEQRAIPSAIATARTTPSKQLEAELEEIGFAQYISFFGVRASSHDDWKDKRAQIAAACEATGVSPHQAMIVGDIPADIESARAAGLGLSVAVLSGGIRRAVLEASRPDVIVSDISELSETLFGLPHSQDSE